MSVLILIIVIMHRRHHHPQQHYHGDDDGDGEGNADFAHIHDFGMSPTVRREFVWLLIFAITQQTQHYHHYHNFQRHHHIDANDDDGVTDVD